MGPATSRHDPDRQEAEHRPDTARDASERRPGIFPTGAGLPPRRNADNRPNLALAGVIVATPFTLAAIVACLVFRPGFLESVGAILGTNVGIFAATVGGVAIVQRLPRGRD